MILLTTNLERSASENARHIAALMRVEADKFGKSYYRLTRKSYDRCLLYYGLEQVMLNLAESIEADKDE